MKTLVNFVMKFYIQLNQALMTSRRSRQIERKSSFVLLFNSDFFFFELAGSGCLCFKHCYFVSWQQCFILCKFF